MQRRQKCEMFKISLFFENLKLRESEREKKTKSNSNYVELEDHTNKILLSAKKSWKD